MKKKSILNRLQKWSEADIPIREDDKIALSRGMVQLDRRPERADNLISALHSRTRDS